MPRKAPIPCCSEKDRQTLAEWANSRSIEWRLVERAKIINMLL
ncbi:MAG: IS630 family transposase, partial [Candidatus Brocadia sp. AMX2]